MNDNSEFLFDRARRVLPGGVNSPARAFRSVGGTPRFLARGQGARVWDEDGREYLDYVCAWGPLLFGHTHEPAVEATVAAARAGLCLGAPTRVEVEYAELFIRLVGWADQVRVMNSGSEAAATALRLARGVTGRPCVIKFEGGYHGHTDAFLRQADPGQNESTGVPREVSANTLLAPYNDAGAVDRLVLERAGEIAAVFVEPVAANMGVVAPAPGFLEALRRVCTNAGVLLVFDEVVTGFRLERGGAIQRFGVRPDLAVYGKVGGGGLPFGAVAGPRAFMERLAPTGRIFHAGTFAGNPLTMAAGVAQLRAIDEDPALYERLDALGALLEAGISDVLHGFGDPCWLARVASMWTLFFTPSPVVDWASAARSDANRFSRFFHALLRQGVSIAPSQFEANFISAAHAEGDIAQTVAAIRMALAEALERH